MMQNLSAGRIKSKDIGFNVDAARGFVKGLAQCWKQLHTVFKQGDGIASFEARVRMS
jgi:hypothetical protein